MVAIHDNLLAQFGGLPGLRDAGVFESALARVQKMIGVAEDSIMETALAAWLRANTVQPKAKVKRKRSS